MIENVKSIACEAGKAILSFYGQAIPVEKKADDSPLTKADLAAHHVILKGLQTMDDSIPVLSEESSEVAYEERQKWEQFWVVDPMDGTKEFIKQTGEFTVNIALVRHGQPVLGVVYVPAQDLFYWAENGKGAFKQATGEAAFAIKVRTADKNQLSIVASRDHAGPKVKALLDRFSGSETQSMGSSLKFCLVAEGKADVYLRDVPTMEWDTAAAQCVVEQAGGVVQDIDGKTLSYNKPVLRNPSIITLGDAAFDWR
ncbi:MAG: 3'(2'),5'-bisphosphate nucleotidase CysQ [Verrucomicrobia bacterium]|jgi:3'(2'), 5'-bisphosphate nucleotidase|nr:3'(2'),5'-bisphosphate nucleotidase CysQ [Verrucomicrobiota bacterium]